MHLRSRRYDRTNITWLRGGTAPEVVWTTFQSSSNGTDWVQLGQGARIPGGWQLSGASLGAGTFLRARGAVIGSDYNSTSWFVGSQIQVGVPRIAATDGMFGLADGNFGFTVNGWSGQKVAIQASSDLREWSGLQTNLLETDSIYFSEPATNAATHRFYRLRLE